MQFHSPWYSLRSVLVAAWTRSCNVRQVQAQNSDFNRHHELSQGNTPTLPSYSIDILHAFQKQDPVLSVVQKLWDRKQRPTGKDWKALSKPVRIKECKECKGLLYWVVRDVSFGEC